MSIREEKIAVLLKVLNIATIIVGLEETEGGKQVLEDLQTWLLILKSAEDTNGYDKSPKINYG